MTLTNAVSSIRTPISHVRLKRQTSPARLVVQAQEIPREPQKTLLAVASEKIAAFLQRFKADMSPLHNSHGITVTHALDSAGNEVSTVKQHGVTQTTYKTLPEGESEEVFHRKDGTPKTIYRFDSSGNVVRRISVASPAAK